MQIEYNRDRCEGHAQCEIIAPEYFEVDDDGKAVVVTPTVADKDLRRVEEAAMRCPVAALELAALDPA